MLQTVTDTNVPLKNRTQPVIGDYAIIGDCRTAALVSRGGSIDWLCLPHFSGPSVFAALLDPERGGSFHVRPEGRFTARRRYLGPSAVLETVFETSTGAVRVVDCMPMVDGGGLRPMREVLRVVDVIRGEVVLDLRFAPRPNYARAAPRIASRGALGWTCTWKDELFLLHTDAPLSISPDGLAVEGQVRAFAGDAFHFSLSYAKGDIGVVAPLDGARKRVDETREWWCQWSARGRYDGPHREAVLRSAVALKMMTFALSGAVVAAPTASLPEVIGADRNWDYRYCWLRDAALTMRAFTGLGYRDEAGSFLQWLLHATRLTWPELQVVYDVYGRTDLQEEELGELAGYRGSRPVRIGNGANRQMQLDVYGEVVAAAYEYATSGGRLQRDEAKLLAGLANTACKKWREPDHGIWEIRGEKRNYTFSKVMCWVALDRMIRLHEQGHARIDVEAYRREREKIAEAIEARGYREDLGSYVGEFDGNALDASLLLMACLGYRDARDPRMRGTFERVRERLGKDGLLYRYHRGYDGMASEEGAFGICSLWAVECLARQGRLDEAERAFEHVLSFANDVGLFAEEIDVDSGTALGNFPQAFTHVGVINAAMAIAAARKE